MFTGLWDGSSMDAPGWKHDAGAAATSPMRRRTLALAAAALVASLGLPAPHPASAATVFEAVGGMPAIERIVERMFALSLADDRIKAEFDNINVPRLKGRIAVHLCHVSGGPCEYRGIPMRGAHAGLDLTQRHFNALVENLQAAMDAEGVPFRTQNRLLAILAPMQRDVVTK